MSIMYCEVCDSHVDTDYNAEHFEEGDCELVEVAPGVYQSRADVEANHQFDEARDNAL